MPDSIMDQIRAQQAREQAARDRAAQAAHDAREADHAKFEREAPEIIAIMRSHGVAPQEVVMCDLTFKGPNKSERKYRYAGVVGDGGWLLNGVDDSSQTYPTTMHVALMVNGYCLPCIPPSSEMPRQTIGSLVVIRGVREQRYWGMELDAAREVRRLLRE